MNIEEAINHYLELKPCKNWIESIEPSFFFEFAETVITAYEKEKEKNSKAREFIKENSHEFNCKRDDLIELEFDDNTNATDLIDILDGNW